MFEISKRKILLHGGGDGFFGPPSGPQNDREGACQPSVNETAASFDCTLKGSLYTREAFGLANPSAVRVAGTLGNNGFFARKLLAHTQATIAALVGT